MGDSQSIPVDIRIISATNRNLTKLVDEGVIRKDFYFRINVIPINLPSLRERLEDIPLLAEFFFRKNQLKSGKNIQGINNDTMDALVNYWWPGNVRELKGAFETLGSSHMVCTDILSALSLLIHPLRLTATLRC